MNLTRELSEAPKLDRSFLVLEKDEEEFYRSETGITDLDELKEHIFAIQEEAYKVFPFNCIRAFSFTKMKIYGLPLYQEVLQTAKARSDAIFLDAGCCFGNHPRKLIHDGFPMHNVVATDLYPEFWNLGHKLFKTGPESFPVKFIPGNIFDPALLDILEDKSAIKDRPDLPSLTSLNPLRGHVSFIHTSSFFHLFDEEQQFKLARLLAGLLDPRPGSMIFGSHAGMPQKGLGRSSFLSTAFSHSPESWIKMWENEIFETGSVKAEAVLSLVRRPDADCRPESERSRFLMNWSVRRI